MTVHGRSIMEDNLEAGEACTGQRQQLGHSSLQPRKQVHSSQWDLLRKDWGISPACDVEVTGSILGGTICKHGTYVHTYSIHILCCAAIRRYIAESAD